MSAGPSIRRAKRKRSGLTPNELRARVNTGDADAAETLIKRDSALSKFWMESDPIRAFRTRDPDRVTYAQFVQLMPGMLTLDLDRDQAMQMTVLLTQCIHAAGLTYDGNAATFRDQRLLELFELPGPPFELQGYDNWPAATILALAQNPDASETAKKAKREIRARYHAHRTFSLFVDEFCVGIELPEFPNTSLDEIASKCQVPLVTLATKLLELRPIIETRAPGTDAPEFAEAIKGVVLTELLGINPGNTFGLAHFRDCATESE